MILRFGRSQFRRRRSHLFQHNHQYSTYPAIVTPSNSAAFNASRPDSFTSADETISSSVSTQSIRRNEVGIQMIPTGLHAQLFPNTPGILDNGMDINNHHKKGDAAFEEEDGQQRHQLHPNSLHKREQQRFLLEESLEKELALNSEKEELAKKHLAHHQLLGKTSGDLPEFNLVLPSLLGLQISQQPQQDESNNSQHKKEMGGSSQTAITSIATHFYRLGLEQQEPYLTKAIELTNCKIPQKPEVWQRLEGWTRYKQDGTFESIEAPPPGESLIFDVEVMYKLSPFPLLAVAVSPQAWYSWISPGFFTKSTSASSSKSKKMLHALIPKTLIPFGSPDVPRLVVGHFIAYDRARIKEEYAKIPAKIEFLDTLSLHSAVGGLSTQQRSKWMQYYVEKHKPTPTSEEDDGRVHWNEHGNASSSKEQLTEMQQDSMDFYNNEEQDSPNQQKKWQDMGSLNSLSYVAELHLGVKMDKSVRKEFEGLDIAPLRDEERFQSLMTYCATDVDITFQLFQSVFPKFKTKCPHPVSFAGCLHMSKGYLTTGDNWTKYINASEEKYNEYRDEIERKLEKLATDALALLPTQEYLKDPWLRNLDWTVKPQRMTKEIISKKGVVAPSRPFATSNPELVGMPQWYRDLWDPKLKRFRLSTAKKVVPYLLKMEWNGHLIVYKAGYGWMYHGTPEKVGVVKDVDPIPQKEDDDFMIPGNVYYRIPHPSGDGKNVGNPLSKAFIKAFETDILTSNYAEAKNLLTLNSLCVYWTSARARITSQFVVWDKDSSITGFQGEVGIILPLTAPMGTITRRATDATWMTASNAKSSRVGSELKAQIVAPKGYKFVGADVDSEELWIASLIGDSQFGIHGASAVGFMTLQGTKSLGTDLHSSSGRIVGISRDVAKIFNYSRIYGAGSTYAARLLVQHNPNLSKAEAQEKASSLYAKTKGLRFKDYKKEFGSDMFWYGGSESFMFNGLEMIANATDSRTPVLGCQIPDTLLAEFADEQFKTSRINWVVQSSGVDYLHLLLVGMEYLVKTFNINARFVISIHDEVRYLVKEEDVPRAAIALQIANLWTRALFCYKLGMKDIPLNIAFFSAIDIDHVLRKEVDMSCITPSNLVAVTPGVSQDIYKTLNSLPADWNESMEILNSTTSSSKTPVTLFLNNSSNTDLEKDPMVVGSQQMSFLLENPSKSTIELLNQASTRFLRAQMSESYQDVKRIVSQNNSGQRIPKNIKPKSTVQLVFQDK